MALVTKLLDPSNSPASLISGLLVVSQAARSGSAMHHEALAVAGIILLLPPLLRHADAAVRARAANLLGNLCRHSSRFYGDLATHGIVPALIELCKDPDRSARKFACFAIGNAGFHNASLYPALRPAVAPLVALLRQGEEDRTRANAAGALGNLVRNGGALCSELVGAGALTALLEVVQRADPPATTSTAAPEANGSLQIALFSLGNLCAHPECASALQAAGLEETVAALVAGPWGTDPVVHKYAGRVWQKLQQQRSRGH